MPQLKDYSTPLNLSDYPDDFSPCHRRVLSARNIQTHQLKKSLSQLHNVNELFGAKEAAERMALSIEKKEKIVIVGDYDADGATAMSVLLSVLQFLKANVASIVPNRVKMGYGLSESAVALALEKKAQLVITVDNGVSAVDSVAELKKHDVDVIITDHHLAPKIMPSADVIVNPNQPRCAFPSKALAGVGVAFYVVLALRQYYRGQGDTRLDNFPLASLLPLVAIGTVADVVPMDFNNRVLVENGLKRIRAGQAGEGIMALIAIAELDEKTLSASDIAFQIAPRLNAAGRIADMQLGVDCLMASNERLAMDYAIELDRLNKERKAIENEMRLQADALLAEQAENFSQPVICLCDSAWNEGLIGIVAARLKDKYAKTAFVFTAAQSDGETRLLKASARASKGVNVIDALNQVNANNPCLINNYGGHAKAAGLVLKEGDLSTFITAINAAVEQQLAKSDIDEAIYTDGQLLPYELNIANADFLKTLEPWGAGLPAPIFRNSFYIDSIREVGKNHAQLMMIESQSGQVLKGIAFDKYAYYHSLSKQQCVAVYQLDINEWRGQRSLSLMVTHLEKEDF